MWDGFPVADGHSLVVPRRHFSDWFDATSEEQQKLLAGIVVARQEIETRFNPDGFNIGINVGEAAGQTVQHLHIHVIPRYRGDVRDPRGGVRHVIPGKGNYIAPRKDAAESAELYVADIAKEAIFGTDRVALLDGLGKDLVDASSLDLAVAFVTASGLHHIEPYIVDLLESGGSLRLLTGDYLDVTEPRALHRMLDLVQEYAPNVQVRVFQTDSELGFHPKAYLLHRDYLGATAYIGSSNLTKHALHSGVEWNQRIEGALDQQPIAGISEEFAKLFTHGKTVPLSSEWIATYAKRRKVSKTSLTVVGVDADQEAPEEVATPHPIQAEALVELNDSRKAGNRAGLVVMATGLGKTWLAAFDSVGFDRVLFVAHREEILNQALNTFRKIRPDANLGLYMGGQYDTDADVLFASIQTLGRANHLRQFSPERFDYIVVDEFHHAAASTYRRLIDYFEPNFMLGLTATPERTDGGDLLALCGENLVFRCDLIDGIERKLLCPFAYFGVPDEVDFSNIPWRSGRFDPQALEFAVATDKRAQNAFEQWQKHGQSRTLAFCVSKQHADFMADFFGQRGVKTVAVHSGPSSAPRANSLENLERGELQVVFAVDMFNEGVDVPTIDTVMMLRPTESKILWLQQFGRGLRSAAGKSRLNVIDYIGNHKTFLKVPALLFPNVGDHVGEVRRALAAWKVGELELPPGCSVEYELEAIEILEKLAKPLPLPEQTIHWYQSFREIHGRRPTASEAYHEGFDPKG
jgi:superfamily II DNA or RNA helicase/diadenosine tetraphosphate (Ap4A) HIT family hydrolase/HKD family nuclease